MLRDGDALDLAGPSPDEGSLEVLANETTVFELIATGRQGAPASKTLTIEVGQVEGPPSIASFSAPEAVGLDESGLAKATLSWTGVERADELILEADTKEPVILSSSSMPDGSVEVDLTEDTDFTLIARNALGETIRKASTRVVLLPVIDVLSVDRSWVGMGESVTISWETQAATQVELWIDGDREEAVEVDETSGTHSFAPLIDAVVELRAFNEAGATLTRSLNVVVAAPQIDSFEGSELGRWLGQTLVLSWMSQGGRTLQVEAAGNEGPICESDDLDVVDASSCEWEIMEAGEHVFTLSVTNTSGVTSETWTAAAGAGPVIETFSVTPSVISVGDEATIRWSALPDPAGEMPQLVLEDDRGTIYPVSSATGELVVVPGLGAHSFKLRASTSHELSTAAEAIAELLVDALPAVDLSASPLHFDEAVNEDVVFSWTSANAASLVLYRLEHEAPVEVVTVTEAERPSGEFRHIPSDDATYQIVATNMAGATAAAEVSISLAPPRVVSFSLDQSDVVSGQPVTLSWVTEMASAVRLSAFTSGYLVEETFDPYVDIEATGTTTSVPMGLECYSGMDDPVLDADGCVAIDLPEGFTFPFDGAERTKVRVFQSGALSFDQQMLPDTPRSNVAFPTTAPGKDSIHLAPFWTALMWEPEEYPAGNLHYLLRKDPGGDSVVIQWKDISFDGPNDHSSTSLNFEIILWENGDFEYRYGKMESASPYEDHADGALSTIGFQTPSKIVHQMLGLNDNLRIRGPLYNRTFRFRPIPLLERSGSLVWYPYSSRDQLEVTLTATRGAREASETLSLTVRERPGITISQSPQEPVLIETDFRIGWETERATLVEIFDSSGGAVCRVDAQASVNQGFCTAQASVPGEHLYSLRATGSSGAYFEREFSVTAYSDFGISSFQSDLESVEGGQGVTLSWVTENVKAIRVTANGVPILYSETDLESGSLVVPILTIDTTFVLTVSNELGMTKEAEVLVEMWTIDFGVTSPSSASVWPGDPFNVNIVATSLDGGSAPAVFGTFPMTEVTDPASAFSDISAVEGAKQLPVNTGATNTINDITFQAGFEFPYFDALYSELRIHVDGYVSFSKEPVTPYNASLPSSTSTANAGVHFAPFWHDLNPREAAGAPIGSMWTLETENSFVIQWTKMSMNSTSTNAAPHDLNFQLVLHRSGAFEYRYGTMKGLAASTHTACHPTPSNCDNEANGAVATIGYQDPTGTMGFTLHFGGSNPGPLNLPFDGGLSNRTFRAEPLVGSGVVTFHPTQSATYTFCSKSGERPVCKSIDVTVDFGIDAFTTIESSIPFGDAAVLSWETTGGKQLVIRKDGEQVVLSTSDPATIDAGTLSVSPGTNSTYTLELIAPLRKDSSSVDIEVVRLGIEPALSSSTIVPGTPVALSWTLDIRDPAYQPIVIAPMEEIRGVTTGFDYFDLLGDPDAQELIKNNVASSTVALDFAGGFTFPYLGQTMSSVRVSSEGYLSFSSSTPASPSNQPLPNTNDANRRVHIAPFWDDLHTRVDGRVYAKLVDPDTYVVQWSRISLTGGSTNANQGSLNFMVVLRRSGEFEFRYGQMLPQPTPAANTLHCWPVSCVNESNGSSATIGYQDLTGSVASLLHYGGGAPSPANRPVGGGLAGRSWKYTPRTSSGSVQVAPWDTRMYEICSIERVSRDISCSRPVEVQAAWEISSFSASPNPVVRDQQVTLAWDVGRLDEMEILANGVMIQSYTSETLVLVGSITHIPNATTTYTLRGSSLGRPVREERLVDFRTLEFEMQGPSGRHFPGDLISIDWNLNQLESGPYAVTSPMIEIGAGPGEAGQFQDVSGLAGAIDATLSASNGHSSQPIPFDFPFFGKMYRQMRVHASGYISFDVGNTSIFPSNTPLPTMASERAVHLAVFWDQLSRRGSDKIWLYQPDPQSYVIQWTNFNRTTGSSATDLYDLNFQIVLFADGAFEYRYGKMAPPPPPFSSSSCYPDTCLQEANGSSATIGYQTVDGEYGFTFHYGGNLQESVELPGGLNNRTLRFNPTSSGKAEFVLEKSKTVTLCASVGIFKECKSVFIEAVAHPGDLAITEVMIDPAGGASNQWFEVRNLSKRVVDLEGFEIKTDQATHTIATSLPVAAGEYLTFAASSGVGFAPSYSYGSNFSFDTRVDTLEVKAGTATISSVNWDVGWTIPSDTTVFLDPSYLSHGVVSDNAFNHWCMGSAAGTPGQRSEGCQSPYYDVELYSDLPFIDISSIGTRVTAMETWGTWVKLLVPGFSMPYFNGVVSDIWTGVDGFITFSPETPALGPNDSPFVGVRPPTTLPRGAGLGPEPPLFAVFWDQFICAADSFPCSFHFHQGTFNGQDMVILQWTGYKRAHSYTSFYEGSATFQAQLWSDGTIVTALADVYSTGSEGMEGWSYYYGSNAWIGLEAPNREYVSAHHRRTTDMSHRSIVFTRK